MESIVCKTNEFMHWHKRDCLFGECDKCGVNLLPLCPKETKGFDDYVVTWRQFALGQTMLMASKPQKKLNLLHKVTPIDELIAYLKPKF
jgi:hypothetical protein